MWPGVLGRFAELLDKRARYKRNHDRQPGFVANSGGRADKYEAAPGRSVHQAISDTALVPLDC